MKKLCLLKKQEYVDLYSNDLYSLEKTWEEMAANAKNDMVCNLHLMELAVSKLKHGNGNGMHYEEMEGYALRERN